MLNQDKLKRIRGILSAKEGTQVPKFQNPSGSMPSKYQIYSKWAGKKAMTEEQFNSLDEYHQNVWMNRATGKTDSGQDSLIGTLNQQPDVPKIESRQDQIQNLTQGTVSNAELNSAQKAINNSAIGSETPVKETSTIVSAAAEAPKITKVQEEDDLYEGILPEVTVTAKKLEGQDPNLIGENSGTIISGGNADNPNDPLLMDPSQNQPTEEKKPETFAQKAVNFLNNKEQLQKVGSVGSAVGKLTDLTSNALVHPEDYAEDSFINSKAGATYDSIATSLMGFSPLGTVVGGAMKVGALINNLGGSKTDKFAKDEETLAQVGGSYDGSSGTINQAANKAGKKYGLFEGRKRKKANEQIAEAKTQQQIMAGIAKDSMDRKMSSTLAAQSNNFSYRFQMDGGYDQRYLHAAKDGAKIQYFKDPFKVTLSEMKEFSVTLTDAPSVFKNGGTILDQLEIKPNNFNVILSDPDDLQSFKQGGTLKEREIEVIETNTTQKSVIPEGALHKNKHHLDEVGIDDSELTKKGIPVVDNEGDQQAEIELNEIIFTLEVTKELESRYKEFYEEGTKSDRKDELAIEAGKLLWKEILYNTDDRTGLIDTLKQGGIIGKQSEERVIQKSTKEVTITQEDINKMVKQALLNLLT